MNSTIAWLLESEPYVALRTRIDLLGQSPEDAEVRQVRAAMLSHPLVQTLLSELAEWPGNPITNHKKANLLLHKLAFAAELGVTADDPGMAAVAEKILQHLSEQGVPEVVLTIPKVFGGTGEDMWAWTLCDTPRLLFALRKMGVQNEALTRGLHTLTDLVRDNGWPCAASPGLGRFHGPGRRTDTCPYATLLMLSALIQAGETDHPALHTGAESLLHLWNNSRELAPFLFHMGTDFRKLKAPFIWYDILHVADVLSRLPWLRQDARMLDILQTIQSKADKDGRYTSESVWMAWKGWDFCQKKLPSPWLTFTVLRILKQSGQTA